MRKRIFEFSDYHRSRKFKPSSRPIKRQFLSGGGGTGRIRLAEIVTLGWLVRVTAAIIKLQQSRVSLVFAHGFKLAEDIFLSFIQRLLYGKKVNDRMKSFCPKRVPNVNEDESLRLQKSEKLILNGYIYANCPSHLAWN